MSERFLLKDKATDAYYDRSMKEVGRISMGVHESSRAATLRAQRKFGEQWNRKVELISLSDVMANLGRKGGSNLTEAKLASLQTRCDTLPVKWWQGTIGKRDVIVGSRTVRGAADALKKAGIGKGFEKSLYWAVYRNFKVRTTDFNHHKPVQLGVWEKINKEWIKIL